MMSNYTEESNDRPKMANRANELMMVDIPNDVICGNLKSTCWCHTCNRNVYVNGLPFALTRMILCPDCGNKRCPKATDHTLECTNSNDPGQKGSTWENYNRNID